MKNPIITISRQFGSGGRKIGEMLAQELGVPFYDKNILDKVAEDKGYSREMIEEEEMKAKNSFLYNLYNAFAASGNGPEGATINEKFFLAQFDYITKIADEDKGCVIVGRCADYVLGSYKRAANVFIYAEEGVRMHRAVSEYGVKEGDVGKYIEGIDRARANYYRYHTGRKWGEFENYHLGVDSGFISSEDIVSLIKNYLEFRR